MTLSKDQIDKLFLFTEKKLVRHYDLQLELVDHLAEQIEEEMEVNRTTTFEKALEEVYHSFGIFGFAKVVQTKTEALHKQYKALWWHEVKALFTLPALTFSVITLLLICFLVKTVDLNVLRVVTGICSAGCIIYFIRCQLRKKKMPKKLMLFEAYRLDLGITPAIYLQLFYSKQLTGYPVLFAVHLFVIVINMMAFYNLNEKITAKAIKNYPDAFAD